MVPYLTWSCNSGGGTFQYSHDDQQLIRLPMTRVMLCRSDDDVYAAQRVIQCDEDSEVRLKLNE